jgi:hypothetical protein
MAKNSASDPPTSATDAVVTFMAISQGAGALVPSTPLRRWRGLAGWGLHRTLGSQPQKSSQPPGTSLRADDRTRSVTENLPR